MRADQRDGTRRGFYFGGTFLGAFLGHARLRFRKRHCENNGFGRIPRTGSRPSSGEMLAPLAGQCKPDGGTRREIFRWTVKSCAIAANARRGGTSHFRV